MIGKVIYSSLNNNADITAIVDGRIYPVVIPQGQKYPAIAYAVTGGVPDKVKQTPATINNATVDIKAVHKEYLQTIIMGDHIRQTLDKLTGTIATVDVIDTIFDGESSPIFDNDAGVFMNILTFNFFYKY